MCIVMMFPKGSNKSSEKFKKAIISGLESNQQSAGYCYKKAGEKVLHFKKGFLKETPTEVAEHILALNLKEEDELMVHGRIPTHGTSDASQAHPFVCSSNPEEACKEEGTTKLPVISHNGMFHKLGDRNGLYSDSAEFAMKILSDPRIMEVCKRNPEKFVQALKDRDVWGWSKVGIMFPDREMMVLGPDWIRENSAELTGIFSNNGYKYHVYNRGGVENRSCSINPNIPLVTDSIAKKSTKDGVVFESSYAIKSSKEGSSITVFVDAIFRTNYGPYSVFYSNNRIIPNIFNYLFLTGRVNVAYYNDNKLPTIFYGREREDFIIKFIDKESSKILIYFPKISSIHFPIDYKDLIKYCVFEPVYDYREAVNLDLQITPSENDPTSLKYDLFDSVSTYEDLLSASDYTRTGQISRSYSKKLYHILERNITTVYFGLNDYNNLPYNVYSTNSKLLNNLNINNTPMWGLSKNTLTHDIHTNKEIELKSPKLLGIFLFFIERSGLLGDYTFSFSEIQVRQVLASQARKYNIIFTGMIPTFVNTKESEKIYENSLMLAL